MIGLAGVALAGTAHAAPCEPLPSAAPEMVMLHKDVDGDGAADTVIPTECDGKANCTLAVFLRRKGCPVAFGSVKGSPRALAQRTRPWLPLTSHGLHLLVTEQDLHHGSAAAVWGWTGDGWTRVYDVYRWFDANRPDHHGTQAGVPDEAASLCLVGREAGALRADDAGTRLVIHRVACTTADDIGCGNWLTVAHGRCLAPVAVLADGRVELVQRAGEAPAVLRVRGGGRVREYRVAITPDDAQPGATLVGQRSCTPRGCDDWAAVEPPPAME